MTGEAEHSRRKVLGSATWATIQQFIVLGSTAVSSVILARTLSLHDFGVFSYATNLASMGTVIVTAGLSGLAIKVLVNDLERQHRAMTALVLIRESFALISFSIFITVALTTGQGDIIGASAIALLVLFSRAFDATEYWFQSRVESQKTAPIRISVVLIMLIVRLLAAFAGASLIVFLVLYVLEAVVSTVLLLVRYVRDRNSPGFGRMELQTPRSLLGKSWILLSSSVLAQINTRGSVLIIQLLLGTATVGVYSVASRISEILYFLPAVFMTATFPALLAIRKKHGPQSSNYRRALQRSYDQSFWVGVGLTAALFALGPAVIVVLFGERYSSAGPVLQVQVLALPFVFMAAVFSKWIVAEDLLVASLVRHGLAAVINIGLNFLLLPSLGLIGSAYATLVSYIVASYLSCFASRSTRLAGIQMTLALVAPIRLTARWITSRKHG